MVAAVVAVRHRAIDADPLNGRYTCPMHPQVARSRSGECPICGMALVRIDDASSRAGTAGTPAVEDAPGHGRYIVRSVVFTDTVRTPAWVESPGRLVAHLYNDELEGVTPGEHGAFFPARSPAAAVDVRFDAEPPSGWDCCTSRIHMSFDAKGAGPRRGDAGWLRLPSRARHALLVPYSAVLQSAAGPYVLAVSPDTGSLEPRAIAVGKVFSGNAVVLSGLRERDAVAFDDLFFLEAERRRRQTPKPAALRER
jgi:Heavy metal binding domain